MALGHDTTEAINTRGRIALGLTRYDDAAADFDEVIRRAPAAMFGHYNRGLTEKLRGRWAEALGHFTKALEVEPGDEDSTRQRDEMLVKLGREREIWRIRLVEAASAVRRAALAARNQASARAAQTGRERVVRLDERLTLDPYDDAARLERARLLAASADGRRARSRMSSICCGAIRRMPTPGSSGPASTMTTSAIRRPPPMRSASWSRRRRIRTPSSGARGHGRRCRRTPRRSPTTRA